MPKVLLSAVVDEDVASHLRDVARREDRSMSSVIRLALRRAFNEVPTDCHDTPGVPS